MGSIIILPFVFLAFITWGAALTMILVDDNKNRIHSIRLSLALSPLFSFIGIACVAWSWSDDVNIGYLAPFIDAALYNVCLPGFIGFILLPFYKQRIVNILCYAILTSVLITPLLLLVFPQLNDPKWYFPERVLFFD